MNFKPLPFKQNWRFYFKFIGLGLIVASFISAGEISRRWLTNLFGFFGLLFIITVLVKKKK